MKYVVIQLNSYSKPKCWIERHFQTIPDTSRQFQTLPDNSRHFQTIPDTSRQFQFQLIHSITYDTALHNQYLYVKRDVSTGNKQVHDAEFSSPNCRSKIARRTYGALRSLQFKPVQQQINYQCAICCKMVWWCDIRNYIALSCDTDAILWLVSLLSESVRMHHWQLPVLWRIALDQRVLQPEELRSGSYGYFNLRNSVADQAGTSTWGIP